jgi:DNA-binding MarR family transcriptional regulator
MDIEDILKSNSGFSLHRKAMISIIYTNGIVNNILNDALKPFDISLQQFNVLRILLRQKGEPISLEKLHQLMLNKMSNTTRLVDKLIIKGLVNKEVNKTNRRKIDITISQEGLNTLEAIDKLMDETEKSIIGPLTDNEIHDLIRLLGKVRLIAN